MNRGMKEGPGLPTCIAGCDRIQSGAGPLPVRPSSNLLEGPGPPPLICKPIRLTRSGTSPKQRIFGVAWALLAGSDREH